MKKIVVYPIFLVLMVTDLNAGSIVKRDLAPTRASKKKKDSAASQKISSSVSSTPESVVECLEKENKKAITNSFEMIDKIAIIIYTDEAPIIITAHDLQCKSLDGRERSEAEIIFERLAYYEAMNVYHMVTPEDSVDKHLASIREQHGVDDEHIKQLFKDAGYSFEDGKEQLRMSYALQRFLQELIINRIIISESEIKDYYDKHPVKEPASYRVQKGFIKDGMMTESEIDVLVKDGQGDEDVEWSNPYWLNEDEIADHKKFIIKLRPGEISKAEKVPGGHEVIKLIKRKQAHTMTMEERYADIANALRYPKYEELLADYKKKLIERYEIVRY